MLPLIRAKMTRVSDLVEETLLYCQDAVIQRSPALWMFKLPAKAKVLQTISLNKQVKN